MQGERRCDEYGGGSSASGVVALLIPTHNEERTIGRVLDGLPRQTCGMPVVPVVIADGCTDNTAQQAANHAAKVVTLTTNQGVGAATLAGMNFLMVERSSGRLPVQYMLKVDADGQHQPTQEIFDEMIRRLRSGQRLVAGARFHPDSKQEGTPKDRRILNDMFAHELRVQTDWPVTDGRTGFMAMDYETMERITPFMVVERYGVPMNIIMATWHVWGRLPAAGIFSEIAVPAIYRGELVDEARGEMYATEDRRKKSKRASDAMEALLLVLDTMRVTTAEIALHCEAVTRREISTETVPATPLRKIVSVR